MKKKFVVLVMLGLLLSTGGRAQTRGYNTEFGYSLRHFADTIPIEIENGQIFVQVEMNGKRHRFNIDTGSSQGMVHNSAHSQDWVELGNVVSRDGAGNLDTVRVVQMPPFTMGRLTITNYVASMFPRPQTKSDYSAVLGFDIFNKGLCCKIDARQKIMIITDRRDFFDGEPGYGIRYKLKWWVPYLLVSPFKRHVDEVLFDTGSRQLFAINKQSFDKHVYKSKNVSSQIERIVEGSFAIGQHGAERPDDVVFLKLERLKWDEFAFKTVRAMTTQGASRIGAQILQYGTVTINGFRRKITFTPYTSGDSVEVNNKMPHVAYVPRNGQATVGLVVNDSKEYKAGLRPGDIILAIDGKAIATFEEFLRYPFVEGRSHRMLVRNQQGQNKTVILVR